MKIHAGTSGFSYEEWKGSFYPEDLPAKRMLGYYAERFSTVEINSTFNKAPTAKAVGGWASAVPEGFRFVLKAPMKITHRKSTEGWEGVMAELMGVTGALGDRRGPLLFQLPPHAKKDPGRLLGMLDLLPKGVRASVEFRHPSWFDDDVMGLLSDRGASLCVADAEGDLEVPCVATADWGYARLRRPDYTDAELKGWLKRWKKLGWREAFVFFRHEDEGKGPRLAARLMELSRKSR